MNRFSMKKIVLLSTVLLLVAVIGYSAVAKNSHKIASQTSIKWITIEEAAALSSQDGKKIMVDLYTDWCGWCKKMDADTYTDSAVVAYINANFHAVKFDAESHEEVVIGDRVFKYLPDLGRNGTHEIAARMLSGKMSYPTTVFLEADMSMIMPVPGYQGASDMQVILAYMAENGYKTTPFDQFKQEYTAAH